MRAQLVFLKKGCLADKGLPDITFAELGLVGLCPELTKGVLEILVVIGTGEMSSYFILLNSIVDKKLK